MALTQAQLAALQAIINTAQPAFAAAGVSNALARAQELGAVAMAESSLDPNSVNRSSGAGGLFQLLSQRYVDAANRMGGVSNPVANTRAILPDYIKFFLQNPNAPVGLAGKIVEAANRTTAGFYSAPLAFLPRLGVSTPPPFHVPTGSPLSGFHPAPPQPTFSPFSSIRRPTGIAAPNISTTVFPNGQFFGSPLSQPQAPVFQPQAPVLQPQAPDFNPTAQLQSVFSSLPLSSFAPPIDTNAIPVHASALVNGVVEQVGGHLAGF